MRSNIEIRKTLTRIVRMFVHSPAVAVIIFILVSLGLIGSAIHSYTTNPERLALIEAKLKTVDLTQCKVVGIGEGENRYIVKCE